MRKVLAAGLAAVFAGVGGSYAATEKEGGDDGPEIVVMRDSPSLPARCSPREVASLIVGFFDAFNRGDQARLAQLFPAGTSAHPPDFQWYSASGPGEAHFAAFRRQDALRYFAERHRHDERMRLLEVDVGTSWVRKAVGIGFLIKRQADDFPQRGAVLAHGKGEIDCRSRRIYVWSMGMGDASFCPGAPGAIRACSRIGRAPNAQEVSPRFTADEPTVALQRRCRPAFVARRAIAMLRAFNIGSARGFAGAFLHRGSWHPYPATIRGAGFAGRTSIARFAARRHRAGDGFTLIRLHTPERTAALPAGAVYGITVDVASRGSPVGERGGKLVVDCASGAVRRWVGPAGSTPS